MTSASTGLLSLPPDMVREILEFFTFGEVLMLTAVCRQFLLWIHQWDWVHRLDINCRLMMQRRGEEDRQRCARLLQQLRQVTILSVDSECLRNAVWQLPILPKLRRIVTLEIVGSLDQLIEALDGLCLDSAALHVERLEVRITTDMRLPDLAQKIWDSAGILKQTPHVYFNWLPMEGPGDVVALAVLLRGIRGRVVIGRTTIRCWEWPSTSDAEDLIQKSEEPLPIAIPCCHLELRMSDSRSYSEQIQRIPFDLVRLPRLQRATITMPSVAEISKHGSGAASLLRTRLGMMNMPMEFSVCDANPPGNFYFDYTNLILDGQSLLPGREQVQLVEPEMYA